MKRQPTTMISLRVPTERVGQVRVISKRHKLSPSQVWRAVLELGLQNRADVIKQVAGADRVTKGKPDER